MNTDVELSRDFRDRIERLKKDGGYLAVVRGISPGQAARLLGAQALDIGVLFESLLREESQKARVTWETVQGAIGDTDPQVCLYLSILVDRAWNRLVGEVNSHAGSAVLHGLDDVAPKYTIDRDRLLKLNGWGLAGSARKGDSAVLVTESIEPPPGTRTLVNRQSDVVEEKAAREELHRRIEQRERDKQAADEAIRAKQDEARRVERQRSQAIEASAKAEYVGRLELLLAKLNPNGNLVRQATTGKVTKKMRASIAIDIAMATDVRRQDWIDEGVEMLLAKVRTMQESDAAKEAAK